MQLHAIRYISVKLEAGYNDMNISAGGGSAMQNLSVGVSLCVCACIAVCIYEGH